MYIDFEDNYQAQQLNEYNNQLEKRKFLEKKRENYRKEQIKIKLKEIKDIYNNGGKNGR